MKEPAVADFAAIIGIDWADRKHDVCELPYGSNCYKSSVIEHTPQALQDWAMGLLKRYDGNPVAVCCELKKGPLIYALSAYPHITLFPINPASVAHYRKVFTHSGAKNDPVDARIQVEILQNHMHKLTPIRPECPKVRALAQLVEYRRKLVNDKVKLTNRVTATLKNYYPQVLDWFAEKDTLIFCDFVAQWPTLAAAKRARKQTFTTFFNQHNSRYPAANEKRITAIKSAVELTKDPGVIEPNAIRAEILINQLKLLLHSIGRLDIDIRQRYKALPDRKIFDSFPGAGPQLAPRLLAAFGTDRERYATAADMQKYAGIAPVIEQSGKQSWTHWRYSCPKFLRQTFVEWAGQSVRFSFWAKAYYQQQIAKGKPHATAIRSLAFKWIRIAFRCWQTHTPYNESVYLEALRKRNSPLLAYAASN